ncbi:hypothetical protein DYQ86_03400 [Acidobacteria bacterium AB60]|nr:hypothetical protein DYQ86_03400 [Acidobacteria bacterium AB60]
MGTEALATTKQAGRTARWRAHRAFFVGFSFSIAFTVFVGFARTYYLAGMFLAKLPSLVVHIHGLVYTAWVALLAVQVVLAAMGRIRWHQRVGIAGIYLAPLVVVLGLVTLADAIRRRFVPPPILEIIAATDCLLLCVFSIMALWAFIARHNPAAHKRAILLATLALLGPAVARLPFMHGSQLVFMAILDAFAAVLVVFDLWTRRSLHRVTAVGVLLTLGWQVAYAPLARSAALDHVIQWLQAP